MTKTKLMIFLGFILLFLGTVSGCAGNDRDLRAGNTASITTDQGLSYRESDIPVPDDFTPVAVRFLQSEIFLFDGKNVLVIDQDGNELRKTILLDDEFFETFDVQADGSFWCISLVNNENEIIIGEKPDEFHFVHFSQDGGVLERVKATGSQFGENEEFIYPYRLIVDNGYFYVMSSQAAYILDKSGQLIFELKAAGGNPRDIAFFRSLFRLNNGTVAMVSNVYGNEISHLIQIPNIEEKITEEIIITSANMNNLFTAGKHAEILFCTDSGFYDYQLETGNQNLIFNSLNYGIELSNLVEVSVFNDDSFVMVEASPERGIDRLVKYIPFVQSEAGINDSSEDDTVIEKQRLTLSAIVDNNNWLAMAIADFNRSNEYYYVEMNDYTMNGSIDFDDAVTRFNIDLITGNISDIIMLPSRMPSNNYINKGLFADLNQFMDSDPDFNRAEYLPGLFEALNRDGKIYEIFPLFLIDVIQAKTADVGSDIGWTLDEFAAFLEDKPNPQYIISDFTKERFIRMAIFNQFINPLTGEPQFNRDEFKKILAIAERFPAAGIQHAKIDEILKGLNDGDPLMHSNLIMSFSRTKIDEYFNFGEETTLKGWPISEGNGLMFLAFNYFSISAQTENHDGAWAFLKYILNNAECRWGTQLSVNLSLLENMAEKAYLEMTSPDAAVFTDVGVYYLKDMEFNRADIDKVMTAIKETRVITRRNPIISAIISEEVDSYLSGQKSADTVADIIENRIGIYLAEQE
ncbi:MAG: hypothetical protein FWE14_01900 [Lachnospiraceae bacterium]|nr:hypothetical protein [Lachnospiraceae bacterium]